MRAVVQRVLKSEVLVDDKTVGKISRGLMVLLGVEDQDTDHDVAYMVEKIAGLRIFEDDEGKMNLSIGDIDGEMLVVSQFTLLGDCRKGRRPSFTKAAKPQVAERLYKDFVDNCISKGIKVEEGIFKAEMLVRIENDGPVTLILDSRKLF